MAQLVRHRAQVIATLADFSPGIPLNRTALFLRFSVVQRRTIMMFAQRGPCCEEGGGQCFG